MHLDTVLTFLSALAGLVAAAFWGCSAWLNIPIKLGSGYGGKIIGLEEMRLGMAKVARWNMVAAAVTAVAVLLQAAAALLSSWH